jgi:dihydrofolate synthase/folylpolyglutamate synthase
MDVITSRCKEFGINPVMVVPEQYKDLQTSLKGAHQNVNAAVALNAIKELKSLGYKISDDAIEEGLKNVRWSGRFEIIRDEPTVVVDCAHNAHSAKALSQTILDEFPFKRVILVLGISEDKDVEKICLHLKDSGHEFILTKADHPRAHQFTKDECQKYFLDKPCTLIEDLPKALQSALKKARKDDVIVVAGSVFVVAQAMEFLCINTKV